MSNPYHEDEPECCFCGATRVELRWKGVATSTKPCDPICEDCYVPQQIGGDDSTGFPPACGVMDGPGFDDLDLCQAAPPETPKGMWGRFHPDEIEAASYRETM